MNYTCGVRIVNFDSDLRHFQLASQSGLVGRFESYPHDWNSIYCNNIVLLNIENGRFPILSSSIFSYTIYVKNFFGPRSSFQNLIVNTTKNNSGNTGEGSPASQTFCPGVPGANIMAENDIKLLILNGNGLEDPKQHWFLCEALWTM